MIIFDIKSGEYLAFRVTTKQSEVLVGLIDEMLIDFAHNGSTVAFLRKANVTINLLNDLNQIDLLSRYDVADVCVDYRIFFEDFLIFKVNSFLIFIVRVFLYGIKT